MTWAGDKKLILDRLVEIYDGIKNSPNRYEASRVLFEDMDFFTDRLMGNDEVLSPMLDFDKEFVEGYLSSMSELMGEEK